VDELRPATTQVPDDLAALSAIIRLKGGLCPLERLEDITIDFHSHSNYVKNLLDSGSSFGDKFGIILGPYGSGKTHILQVTKHLALSQGFAVAHLSQDTGLNSLGHPERHVFNLVRSLRFPSPHGTMLEWLGTLLDDPKERGLFETCLRGLRSECQSLVDSALWILQQAPRSLQTGLLLEYLSGALLIGKTATTSSRLQAYELVRFWVIFATRILGCKGLVLIVDELENLFSNAVYWNILSRRLAYRTLSYYTEALPQTTTVCALTPSGWNLLHSEVQQASSGMLLEVERMGGEKMEALFGRILRTRPHQVTRFTGKDYHVFLDRLAALHSEARAYPRSSVDSSLFLPQISVGMTPRIFAKCVVSALDHNWFERVVRPASGN
jgi:hypothetical protein